jgi:ankyrin repeat protein
LDRQNSFKSAYALRSKDNLESVSESPPLQMQRAFSLQGQELVETLSSSSESVTLTKTKPLRRIKFDPLTLALDYARQGDSIHLQKILESSENTEFFDSILENEGLPSVYDLVTPHTNMSLLHLAASYNHLAVCQYLIEKGANTNVTDLEGWTPLHCCAAEGHSKVVKLLLSVQYILLDKLNSDQETALDVCQDENIKRMIKGKLK